ncbi:MAG TPA: gliding motility lipoprotein GldH [Sphingobacteriaceae bacterium]
MKVFKLTLFAGLFFVLTSCGNSNAIVDTNQEIKGRNWSYISRVKVPVQIENTGVDYSIWINLRHTSEYKYSNIFLLVHQTGPDGKRKTERKEFKLAKPDGEWLGSGSGNLYSYQLLYKENYRFPAKGKYVFELEQNMRDNPLKNISDVGLRVEKEQ